MKAVLICPAERAGVAHLAETMPLVIAPVLGKPFIEYWIQHLLGLGATDLILLAADRPDQVRAVVGDGSRWGVRLEVLPTSWELTAEEARMRYGGEAQPAWLPAPHDALVLDHLPGLPEHRLFNSYADWFAALEAWMPRAITPDRIGWREIQPGVWAGLHAHVSPTAQLRAPCWLGDEVFVGPEAVLGPAAIVENRAWIDRGARVSRAQVGPETYVGKFTELKDCLALGGTLINWTSGLCLQVPDEFLLASLRRSGARCRTASWSGRVLALLLLGLTAPLVLPAILRARRAGERAFERLLAARPRSANGRDGNGVCAYHQLTHAGRWLRRWPQLWNVVRGEFAWVGNRPLNPEQAARLATDFERLWLDAPIGLVSLADVAGAVDQINDDARAHASFYAVNANWRLDLRILGRGLSRLAAGAGPREARRLWPHSLVESRLKNNT